MAGSRNRSPTFQFNKQIICLFTLENASTLNRPEKIHFFSYTRVILQGHYSLITNTLRFLNLIFAFWVHFLSHRKQFLATFAIQWDNEWEILSSGTHVFVIDTFHKHQLPVCSLGVSLVLKGSAEFLNGHISVQDGVISSTARER